MADERAEIDGTCPVDYLKSLIFKVAESTFKPEDPADWPNLEDTSLEERRENASIFLNVHQSDHSETIDGLSLHATVSSTVIIVTESNEMYFWERRYKHSAD